MVMKITVLSGSPKGEKSVTLQYVRYIQKKFPQHEMKIFHVSERIKAIERDDARFREIIEEVITSDGVLWSFPLYVFLVPSQYKRFIELVGERGAEGVFEDKYTAVLTTSIHFYDHTAHNYMRAICDDLEMRYVGSFSAEMYDLLQEKGRERLTRFAESFFESIKRKAATSKAFQPLVDGRLEYIPGHEKNRINTSKKVIVVTDHKDNQVNLGRMIERFKNSFSEGAEVINLHQIEISGGCLGCIQCGYDYECAYTGKDGYIDFYNQKVKKADILVFAGGIRDRYLSSRWKLFFDRSFFNTHTPSLTGKQVGFIVSGPLSQIPNLRQILEAYTEWQQASLVDIVTDEYRDSAQLDGLLQNLVEGLVYFSEKSYVKPRTFLGVGASKVFRDDIWGRLRFPFQADHRFYKKHGIYDFPHKDYKTRAANTALILLTKIPRIRREIYRRRIKEEMVKPLQKVVEKVGQ
jgi:multimeric flavodoxin WrbA